MPIVNLEAIVQDDSPTSQINRIADNFDLLENMLPTSVITDTDDFGVTPNEQTFVITHAQLTQSNNGTSQDIELVEIPTGYRVVEVFMYHTTAFSGGGITNLTVEVGISGDADKYASAFDLLQSVGANATKKSIPNEKPVSGSETINARFFPDVSHNLNALTAGSVTIKVIFDGV